MFKSFHVESLILLALAASMFLPCASANDKEMISRMYAAVRSSNFLLRDYREQANIAVRNGAVTISMYRDPESDQTDCKIDAILLARELADIDSSLRRVDVAF